MRNRVAVTVALLIAATTVVAMAQGLPQSYTDSAQSDITPVASWYGSTGLVAVPSAYIAKPGAVEAGLHRVEARGINQYALSANVTLVPKLEVGVTHLRHGISTAVNSGGDIETVANAKYKLDLARWTKWDEAPDVAIGAFDISNSVNRAWYVVMSKPFPIDQAVGSKTVVAHLGYGTSDVQNGILDGIFGGLEFAPFPRTNLQVEYDANSFNACGRYFLSDTFAIDAGVVDSRFAMGVTLATPF
jgi:hypothetical protein